MTTHPYIRAYLAGIAVPTLLLLLAMTGFFVARYVWNVPVPIERVIPFPMAIVPNLFGVWNIFYVSLHSRRHLPIGLHGALLPFVLAPIAFSVASTISRASLSSVRACSRRRNSNSLGLGNFGASPNPPRRLSNASLNCIVVHARAPGPGSEEDGGVRPAVRSCSVTASADRRTLS